MIIFLHSTTIRELKIFIPQANSVDRLLRTLWQDLAGYGPQAKSGPSLVSLFSGAKNGFYIFKIIFKKHPKKGNIFMTHANCDIQISMSINEVLLAQYFQKFIEMAIVICLWNTFMAAFCYDGRVEKLPQNCMAHKT